MTVGNAPATNIIYGSGTTAGNYYRLNTWNGADRPSQRRYSRVREYYTDSRGKRRYHVRTRTNYSGPDPSTPHSFTKTYQEYDKKPGYYYYLSGGNWVQSPRSFNDMGFMYDQPSWTSNHEIALISKLRDQIVGSDFDLGIFLGEGRESLRLLTDTATRLYRGFRLFKRGKFLAAAKTLVAGNHKLSGRQKSRLLALESAHADLNKRVKQAEDAISAASRESSKVPKTRNGKRLLAYKLARERAHRKLPPDLEPFKTTTHQLLAGAWLELQYGWMPLLQDLRGGAQALAQATLPKQKSYRASKKIDGTQQNVRLTGSGVTCYPQKWDIYTRRGLIAYFKEEDVPTMTDLLDPLTVAWELVGYSFIADWVVPIGDYLKARGFANKCRASYYIYTIKQWAQGSDFRNTETPNRHTTTGTYWRNLYFNRSVLASLAVPTPEVKPLSRVASWQHAANATALLQRFK